MKTIFRYKLPLLLLALVLCAPSLIAQKAKKKLITVEGVVKNIEGEVLEGASVYTNGGSQVLTTDQNGAFKAEVKVSSVVLVEAAGYATVTFDAASYDKKEIVLSPGILYADDENTYHLPMNQKVAKRHAVVAISTIDGEDMARYSDPVLSNTMQGLGLGLIVQGNTGGMASSGSSLYLRGLSRNGNDGVLTLVDGIERSINDINPEAIAEVTLLKDATAKILYGARAANGVLLVTTKRGESHKKIINTKVDIGVGQPTRIPEFLQAYDYAKLYNEACENDGLVPFYTTDDLEGLKNSSGPNDLLYPDVDYYDYFLRSHTNYSKITSEFSGGSNSIRYAVNLGWMNYKGLQTEGETPRNDRFNIRANLDVDITKYLSAYLDMSAILDYWKRAGLDHSSTFASLSTHRPNEYPLIIGEEYIPATNRGIPAFGASETQGANMLAKLAYGGDQVQNFLNSQMNTGFNLDMGFLTEGLSANAFFSFDQFFSGSQTIAPTAATYDPIIVNDAYGQDSVSFVQKVIAVQDKTYGTSNIQSYNRLGYTAQVNYDHEVGAGNLDATVGYFYYRKENQGTTQDVKNSNLYLRSNYVLDDKYGFELDLSHMGSSRFGDGNKYFLSYALGTSWLISEEDFMTSSAFDFLKLKASYGVLGYDAQTSYFTYENRYSNNGTLSLGEKNNGASLVRTGIDMVGNPDLKWESSRDINVGVEGLILDKRLAFEVNYFNMYRKDIIQKVTAEYSAAYGGILPFENFGEVALNGVEGMVDWREQMGDFSYSVGANVVYSKNRVVEKNEVVYTDDYRNTEGLASDVIMGYRALGLFGKDLPLDGAPKQTFGKYAEGDIAYADLNGDGSITDLDREEIGNTFPRVNVGINIDLRYKRWGLYALGTGQFGFDKMLTNTYYRNYAQNKYSVLANDRYHPINKPTGSQPRLTTDTPNNNIQGSDFWMSNASYFRLKNVELSYTISPQSTVKSVKLYARCNNAFSISKIKDLDPEMPNSGVTNYPVFRTITGGVSVTF